MVHPIMQNLTEGSALEIEFGVIGTTIPADHGYTLFSAISLVLPDLHIAEGGSDDYGILPVSGRPVGNRRISVDDSSRLVLRVKEASIASILPLAGKTLVLPGGSLQVGVPRIRALHPATTLHSRLVTIKLRDCAESDPGHADAFLEALRKKVEALGVRSAECSLPRRTRATSMDGGKGADLSRSPYVRRTLSVRGKRIVGYAVAISGLGDQDSLIIQSKGIGGRRHFGCGVFVPATTEARSL